MKLTKQGKYVIKVFVHHGVIVDIANIPADTVIQVFDADIDGSESERLIEENGIAYHLSQWEKQEDIE